MAGLSCGATMAKYILFIFNFVFFVSFHSSNRLIWNHGPHNPIQILWQMQSRQVICQGAQTGFFSGFDYLTAFEIFGVTEQQQERLSALISCVPPSVLPFISVALLCTPQSKFWSIQNLFHNNGEGVRRGPRLGWGCHRPGRDGVLAQIFRGPWPGGVQMVVEGSPGWRGGVYWDRHRTILIAILTHTWDDTQGCLIYMIPPMAKDRQIWQLGGVRYDKGTGGSGVVPTKFISDESSLNCALQMGMPKRWEWTLPKEKRVRFGAFF